jgi:hypothetical protein
MSQPVISPEVRREVIEATKTAMADVPKGARHEAMMKTTMLSTLVMARHLGYTRDEVMFLLREEWRHMTDLDSTTVRKENR